MENLFSYYKKYKNIKDYYDNNITNKVWELFINDMPKWGYEAREGQQDMALDICDAIKENQHIMIEAGVGIGKSYAYLVPLIYYNKLARTPVVISTSTILLQEQLINDIEIISKKLKINIDIVLAKGMTHFKCIKRGLNYLKKNNLKNSLVDWIKNEYVGDRIQFSEDINNKIWSEINVTKCTYRSCDMYKQCYYIKRRNEMLNTNGIILCNHDLLTVDLKRKQNNERNILSSNIKLVVIDEAHNLEEKVRNSSKEKYTYIGTKDFIDEVIRFLKIRKEVDINIDDFNIIKIFYEELRVQIIKQKDRLNNTHGDIERYYLNSNGLEIKIANIVKILEGLSIKVQLIESKKSSDKQDDIIEELKRLINLFKEMINNKSNNLFWIELISDKTRIEDIKIIKCPKTIDVEINNLFFNNQFKTILTSATLTNSSDENDEFKYNYIIKTLGFPIKSSILSTPKQSPYEYNKKAIVYYKENMPHPTNERELFIEKSIEAIVELIYLTKGKTMILFTSKNDMTEVYSKLKESDIPWKIIVQENGKTQDSIIQEFKENENSVLLGTGSYWEGLSIEGKTLSSLIIFRLPFPVPDPVIDYKRTLTDKSLMEVDVPEMIIKLKQGVGRLIRNNTDIGVVTILDSRINDKANTPYKSLIWESLPMKQRTNDIQVIKRFIEKNEINKNNSLII